MNLRRTRSSIDGSATSSSLADEILDEIIPEEVDWRQLVWSYPKSTLALAALGGFLLGRAQGRRLVSSATSYVSETATDGVNEFLGRKVL